MNLYKVPKVYLAGPMSGLTFEQATGWRAAARTKFKARGIDVLDPTALYYGVLDAKDILGPHLAQLYPHPILHPSAYVRYDLNLVRNSDCLLANFLGAENPSLFSIFEIGYAQAKKIPVVLAIEAGNPNRHEAIDWCAAAVVDSLEMAIDFTGKFLS